MTGSAKWKIHIYAGFKTYLKHPIYELIILVCLIYVYLQCLLYKH